MFIGKSILHRFTAVYIQAPLIVDNFIIVRCDKCLDVRSVTLL